MAYLAALAELKRRNIRLKGFDEGCAGASAGFSTFAVCFVVFATNMAANSSMARATALRR
jgi:hypothetical protein